MGLAEASLLSPSLHLFPQLRLQHSQLDPFNRQLDCVEPLASWAFLTLSLLGPVVDLDKRMVLGGEGVVLFVGFFG